MEPIKSKTAGVRTPTQHAPQLSQPQQQQQQQQPTVLQLGHALPEQEQHQPHDQPQASLRPLPGNRILEHTGMWTLQHLQVLRPLERAHSFDQCSAGYEATGCKHGIGRHTPPALMQKSLSFSDIMEAEERVLASVAAAAATAGKVAAEEEFEHTNLLGAQILDDSQISCVLSEARCDKSEKDLWLELDTDAKRREWWAVLSRSREDRAAECVRRQWWEVLSFARQRRTDRHGQSAEAPGVSDSGLSEVRLCLPRSANRAELVGLGTSDSVS